MQKVLYVSKGLIKPTGGAEAAAFQIMKAIVHSKKLKKAFILTNKPQALHHMLILKLSSNFSRNGEKMSDKIKVYHLPLVKLRIPIISHFLDTLRFKSAIKRIILLEKIDLIHIHTYSTFYLTPNPTWNIPLLYTFHDFPKKWPNKPINFFPFNYIEKIWKKIGELYWRIILSEEKLNNYNLSFHCLSSEIRTHLIQKGLSKKRTRLLANGYFESKEENVIRRDFFLKRIESFFKNQNNIKLKILIIGQFNSIKNQFSILKGFEEFSDKNSESILLIAGEPTPIIGNFYIRKIWKSIKPQTKKKIFWLGYISNKNFLTAIYRFVDLIVTMSHSEASPLVLGECKNQNKPILSTNVGAFKDLLPAELKVLNPNSPRSLSIKLEEIYRNKQNLAKYAEMINTIRILSWDEIGEELIAFYRLITDFKK